MANQLPAILTQLTFRSTIWHYISRKETGQGGSDEAIRRWRPQYGTYDSDEITALIREGIPEATQLNEEYGAAKDRLKAIQAYLERYVASRDVE